MYGVLKFIGSATPSMYKSASVNGNICVRLSLVQKSNIHVLIKVV